MEEKEQEKKNRSAADRVKISAVSDRDTAIDNGYNHWIKLIDKNY